MKGTVGGQSIMPCQGVTRRRTGDSPHVTPRLNVCRHLSTPPRTGDSPHVTPRLNVWRHVSTPPRTGDSPHVAIPSQHSLPTKKEQCDNLIKKRMLD